MSCQTDGVVLPQQAKMRVRWILGLLVALLIAILACAQVQAGVQVTVEGVAAITKGNDLGRVRDEALRDAFRRAVEVGVGVMVHGESLMENYAVLRDHIWTESSGYVSSYEVLQETQDQDFYRIKIQASVDSLTLGEDLEGLGLEISLIGNPRIVVTIQDWVWKNEPGAAPVCVKQPFSVAGEGVEQGFLDKGFSLVDAARLSELGNQSAIDDATEGDAAAAAALARALDADLTIAGSVRTEPAGTTSAGGFDWYKALATLSVKVVLRDTAQIISSVLVTADATKTSFASASQAAITQATTSAIPQLVIETIAGLNSQSTEENRGIRVDVQGVHSLTVATGIQDALGAIRESQGADLRTYSNGLAAVDVQFQGTSVDLAQILEAPWFAAKLVDELGSNASLTVTSVDFGAIDATLVSK